MSLVEDVKRYMEHGDDLRDYWLSDALPEVEKTCPRCFVKIKQVHRFDHDIWHSIIGSPFQSFL
jgi:hypothetical protein